MGAKSRGNWNINTCLKRCTNRGELCNECIRFSNFKAYFFDEIKEIDKLLDETNQQEDKNV
jgi:hypothetical protein